MGRISGRVNYSFPLRTFPFIPTKYYIVNFKVHNYVPKNWKKMSLSDRTPSVSEESTQESIVGTMDNRKRLESHIFVLKTWKTTLKDSRYTGKWICFHVYSQTLLKSLLSVILLTSQWFLFAFIWTKKFIEKAVSDWQSDNICFGLQSLSPALTVIFIFRAVLGLRQNWEEATEFSP